jgi:hypothetical protein
MSTLDEALSSSVVKYVPWAPSWEEGIELTGVIHSPTSYSGNARRPFTESERELLHRGVDLIVGAKDFRSIEQKTPIDQILDPTPSHATFHGMVRRIHSQNDIIVLQKERDGTILLEAEKQASVTSRVLWRITSPEGNIGDCAITANQKHSTFYLVLDGIEEVDVCYRKSPGNSTLKCFDVVIPALDRDTGKHIAIRYDGHNSYLLTQALAETAAGDCVKLTVREPQLREGRWILFFNGRVKKLSARNFILILPAQANREILLCGKTAVKQFVFDLNWPLSILQAFAVYLTLFSKPKPN